MDTSGACPSCNQPLPAGMLLGGLCPQCLIKSGFYSGTAPEPEKREKFAAPSVGELTPHFPQLEIIELIGRGGMGAVYKARQPKLNRLVALKILAREGDSDARFAERFQREAQALAHMNHPNIVMVHDFGEAGGHYFLLMEFVDGLNLRQLEKGEKLKPEAALAIVPSICDALQYAHSQGIVHRDIKPENILLDKEGRVKIADFGIAKILRVSPAEPLTGDNQRVGTPHYMAPEQVEKPTTVDHRADIYSLGVVFYEMLTGELPLGRFAAPSRKVQIDVRLDEIVMRALEKEPELRYQQVSEIRTQVETLAVPAAASNDAPQSAERATSTAPDGSGEAQALKMGAKSMIIMLALLFLIGGICSLVNAVLWNERHRGDEVIIGFWICNGVGLLIFSIYKGYKAFYSSHGQRSNELNDPAASRSDEEPRPKSPLGNFFVYVGFFIANLAVYILAVDAFGKFGIVYFFVILMTFKVWGPKLLQERGKTGGSNRNQGLAKAYHGLPASAASIADVRRQLRMPSIMLQIAGYSNMLLLVFICVSGIAFVFAGKLGSLAMGLPTFVALGLLYLALAISGLFIIRGGRLMMKVRNREMAITGAILAMITPPGMVLGLPFGIWTLLVLNQPEIRRAFDRIDDGTGDVAHRAKGWRTILIPVALIFFCLISILILKSFVDTEGGRIRNDFLGRNVLRSLLAKPQSAIPMVSPTISYESTPMPVMSADGDITLASAHLHTTGNNWSIALNAHNHTTTTKYLGIKTIITYTGDNSEALADGFLSGEEATSGMAAREVYKLEYGMSNFIEPIKGEWLRKRPMDVTVEILRLNNGNKSGLEAPDREVLLLKHFTVDSQGDANLALNPAPAVDFSNGVRAEFLGIAAHPENGKVWTADGKSLPGIPHGFDQMNLSSTIHGEQVAREIYLKFTGLSDNDDIHFMTEAKGAIGFSGESRYERGIKYYGFGATFPANQRETKVRVGIASGAWQTVIEGDFSKSGYSGLDSVTGGSYDVKSSGLLVDDGKTQVVLTDNMIGKQIAIELVDTDGKTYRSQGSESSENNNRRQTKFFFDSLLLSESLKTIVVRVRDYEWRQFPFVLLHPLARSQVEAGFGARGEPNTPLDHMKASEPSL